MNKTALQICCFLMLSLAALSTSAQTPTLSPLRQFMQQAADTTIVFQVTSNWLHPSSKYAYFLSKKGDQVTFYAYRDFIWTSLPHTKENQKRLGGFADILKVPEAPNKFFNPVPIVPEQLIQVWSDLIAIEPWRIRDDKLDGEGCPEKVRIVGNTIIEDVNIYDGGAFQLTLITKDQVKTLDFYAPDFYEEQCPGRAGRIAILKISRIFDKYIK